VIAYVSAAAPDPLGAELGRIGAAQIEALRARGHRVEVWVMDARGPDLRGARSQGVPTTEELLARDIDVVYLLGTDTLRGDPAQRFAPRWPVVAALFGEAGPTSDVDQLERAAALRVVLPSVTQVVRVREHVPLAAGRVRVIPPGHGLAEVRPPELSPVELSPVELSPVELSPVEPRRAPRAFDGEGPLRVLLVEPLDAASGAEDLIAAIASLPAGSVRLVARGTPRDVSGRAEWLELHPRGDRASLRRLAAGCHLAALPSRREESYALGLDEAFALGLPAWITSGAVAAERYDRGAFQVLPAGDSGAWAVALTRLCRDPRRSARAFAALPDDIPTAAAAAAALEHLFDDALASHPRTARPAA